MPDLRVWLTWTVGGHPAPRREAARMRCACHAGSPAWQARAPLPGRARIPARAATTVPTAPEP